jgi:rSAM/selenodomain-associated transferase 2
MISIIIPVLNESTTITSLLKHISENASEKCTAEIIVVDGGSLDDTCDKVNRFSENSAFKIQLLSSKKGRAAQMNAGARLAKGEILYFLHADSFPPAHFDLQIVSEVDKGNQAGCFRMKFDTTHPLLKFSQWFTRFNFKFCRGGDQSLFITRVVFDKLAGFNESYIIYEDCEFINRVYDNYGFSIIPSYVVTSSRKYEIVGAWKLQYYFTVIHIKNKFGAPPSKLHGYYLKHILSKMD